MTPITVTIPLRLGTGQNMREHHYVKAKRMKAERHAVAWATNAKPRPPSTMPLLVHLVRVSPGTVKLDDDNLSGAWKAGRDQIAQWLGRDDGHDSVTWTYGQRKGPWGVEITISERTVPGYIAEMMARNPVRIAADPGKPGSYIRTNADGTQSKGTLDDSGNFTISERAA